MFLRALAIYSYHDNHESKQSTPLLCGLQKINFVPLQSLSQLFTSDHLKNLEEKHLPHFVKNHTLNIPTHYPTDDGHHYIIKLSTPYIVIAIASKTKMDDKELSYLFHNITQIHLRPQSVNTSLDDILNDRNQKYTSSDILINKIKKGLDDTKEIMLVNIEKAIEIHDKIEDTVNKAIQLDEKAIQFKKKSTALESRCRC